MTQTTPSRGTSGEELTKVLEAAAYIAEDGACLAAHLLLSVASSAKMTPSYQYRGISGDACAVLIAAFAVASLEEAELRLKHYNIEFHKFLVPGTNASQIFLYDPEG